MRWCLILACVFLTRTAGHPPGTTEEPPSTSSASPTTIDVSAQTMTARNEPGESVTTPETLGNPGANTTELPKNVTEATQVNSTDPQCKSDEKVIEDPTNCHVLCSKGALFYYSAGRKPNGTSCVINKYLEGTKHIESSKPGDCFKGQCMDRALISTVPSVPMGSTAIASTEVPVSTVSSTMSISSTDSGGTQIDNTSTPTPLPGTPTS